MHRLRFACKGLTDYFQLLFKCTLHKKLHSKSFVSNFWAVQLCKFGFRSYLGIADAVPVGLSNGKPKACHLG